MPRPTKNPQDSYTIVSFYFASTRVSLWIIHYDTMVTEKQSSAIENSEKGRYEKKLKKRGPSISW